MSERFETTRWSMVQAAADPADPESSTARADLCQTYWPAVYGFLRRSGHDPEAAQDLTQGFFTRLLEKQSLRVADLRRGRFRSFLLSSVQNFVRNERQSAQRQKREGAAAGGDYLESSAGGAPAPPKKTAGRAPGCPRCLLEIGSVPGSIRVAGLVRLGRRVLA